MKQRRNTKPLLPGSLPEDLYQGILPAPDKGTIRLPLFTGFEPFDRFVRLIHQHRHGISILQLAATLEISPADLNGLISALTGLTPAEWQERYLVLALKELLPRKDIPVHEVARLLGYSRNGLNLLCQRYRITPRRPYRC